MSAATEMRARSDAFWAVHARTCTGHAAAGIRQDDGLRCDVLSCNKPIVTTGATAQKETSR